jgi:pyrroline-5-carboxylate reductase
METLGIIGAGSMGAAMARGWAGAEGGPKRILLTDSGSGRAERLATEIGGEAPASNAELAERAEVVVLAVKPAGLDPVAAEIAGAAKPVVSVLGATSLARLGDALPGSPLIRIMPNVAVEVGRGVVCWAAAEDVSDELEGRVAELLGLLGTEIELDEGLLDAATAVMGCSPAYVALFAEALTDAGVHEGLPEEPARLMVTQTLAGTAALLLDERGTLDVRRSVTSPGGSTAAGLAALERGSVRAAIADAVSASLERMRG